MAAAHRGHGDLFELLVRELMCEKKTDGMILYHSLKGNFGEIWVLLESGVVNISRANERTGITPLHCAAKGGHDDVIELLLDVGADPNKKAQNGDTPLNAAAKNGNAAAVQLLVENDGIQINKADNEGMSPLYAAAKYGHAAVVKLLLNKRAMAL